MKKLINIYFSSWRLLFDRIYIWFLLFVVNLFLAVILSIPLNSYLNTTVGDTLAFDSSKFHFDFILIGDFLNNYGLGLQPIIQQSLVFLVLYYLIQVFFSGGILDTIHAENSESKSFWRSCLKWFFDMFRVSLYALLAQAALIALFVLFFVSLLGGVSPFDIEDEGNMIIIFWIVFPIYLLFAALILCIRDYVKIKHIKGNRKWLNRTIIQTSAWVFRHVYLIIPLFALHVLLFYITNYVYQWIKFGLTGDSAWMLFGLFLVVQGFVFLRLGIRIVHLISVRMFNEEFGAGKLY